MDPTLLNEMLLSLRIIRDEITELKTDGAKKEETLKRLETDFGKLEKTVKQLSETHTAHRGAKNLVKVAWTVFIGLAGLAIGFFSKFKITG